MSLISLVTLLTGCHPAFSDDELSQKIYDNHIDDADGPGLSDEEVVSLCDLSEYRDEESQKRIKDFQAALADDYISSDEQATLDLSADAAKAFNHAWMFHQYGRFDNVFFDRPDEDEIENLLAQFAKQDFSDLDHDKRYNLAIDIENNFLTKDKIKNDAGIVTQALCFYLRLDTGRNLVSREFIDTALSDDDITDKLLEFEQGLVFLIKNINNQNLSSQTKKRVTVEYLLLANSVDELSQRIAETTSDIDAALLASEVFSRHPDWIDDIFDSPHSFALLYPALIRENPHILTDKDLFDKIWQFAFSTNPGFTDTVDRVREAMSLNFHQQNFWPFIEDEVLTNWQQHLDKSQPIDAFKQDLLVSALKNDRLSTEATELFYTGFQEPDNGKHPNDLWIDFVHKYYGSLPAAVVSKIFTHFNGMSLTTDQIGNLTEIVEAASPVTSTIVIECLVNDSEGLNQLKTIYLEDENHPNRQAIEEAIKEKDSDFFAVPSIGAVNPENVTAASAVRTLTPVPLAVSIDNDILPPLIAEVTTIDNRNLEDNKWSSLGFKKDRNGKLHIVYYDVTNGDLCYATNASGHWASQIIDSEGDTGHTPDFVIDSHGKIHVTYRDASNGDNNSLVYTTNVSGNWESQVIDSNGDTGYEPSLAIDSRGKMHVTYHNNTSDDLIYATNASGNWVSQVIDSEEYTGYDSSLAIDSRGKMHVAYHNSTNDDLMYATNVSGNWALQIIDSRGDTGHKPDLVIDSRGKTHIVYHDNTNNDLMYATNASGSWVSQIVDAEGKISSPSLALDQNDKLHISYRSFITSSEYANYYNLMYATNTSGSWAVRPILEGEGEKISAKNSDIILPRSGKIAIAYFDSVTGQLKLAEPQ